MFLGIISNFEETGFEFVQKHNLKHMELCYNVGNSVQAFYDRIDEVNERIQRFGITIDSIGRWGSDKIDEKGGIIESELQDSYKMIDICACVGCPVFNTGVNYIDGISKFENISAAIKFLSLVVEYGKTKGIKVATYNCDWNNYIINPATWELVHGHIKDLGIKYDPSHCINVGSGDYLGEAAAWGERFYHVHIKGTLNINGVHVDDPPAGLDQINWGAFMGVLYAKKYDAMVSIEPHSSTWKGELGDSGVDYTVDMINKLLF